MTCLQCDIVRWHSQHFLHYENSRTFWLSFPEVAARWEAWHHPPQHGMGATVADPMSDALVPLLSPQDNVPVVTVANFLCLQKGEWRKRLRMLIWAGGCWAVFPGRPLLFSLFKSHFIHLLCNAHLPSVRRFHWCIWSSLMLVSSTWKVK